MDNLSMSNPNVILICAKIQTQQENNCQFTELLYCRFKF